MDRYNFHNAVCDGAEHDLGDCEQWWGYTCEDCRQEYQERMVEWAMEDEYEKR